MTYPTRRARIEAEKAQQLALRSQRNKRFTLGVAGLATAASATLFGLTPANAAIDDSPAPASSTTQPASTGGSTSASTYTVKAGDTLGKIAKQQGVSLNQLMSDNGLSASTIIYPGDVLDLPGGSSSQSASQGSSSSEPVTRSQGDNTGTASFTSYETASTSATGSKAAAVNKAVDIVNSSATYRFGANGPSQYDCSSLTQTAFAAAGIDIPRVSKDQFAQAKSHVSLSNLQAGDLVFWSNNGSASGIYHVAMYIGDGKIAQARNPQSGITINSLSEYSKYNTPLSTAARY